MDGSPTIKVAHCIASLSPESGGTARVVRDLTDALTRAEHCLSVLLLSQGSPGCQVVAGQPQARVDQRLALSRSAVQLQTGWALKRLLQGVVCESKPDILHGHGIWLPANHHVSVTAARHGVPLVVHPHGMLERWSMNHHTWRKRLALGLYQRRDLESAALLFATCEQEVLSIRRLGLRQPIAVIPNGVALPPKRVCDAPLSHRDGPLQALFLSRVHPKKGIPNLIEGWSRLRPPNWRLCIAGPDEGGHLDEVMGRVRALRLEESVEYVGPVYGDRKRQLFEGADVFVLPSFSENFGLVVAEALAHGVPVITTHGTPWEELPANGCGWWVEPTANALEETLREVFAMNRETLRSMGEQGRNYVRKFDWLTIAEQTAGVYRWVLGQGPKPECVNRD